MIYFCVLLIKLFPNKVEEEQEEEESIGIFLLLNFRESFNSNEIRSALQIRSFSITIVKKFSYYINSFCYFFYNFAF